MSNTGVIAKNRQALGAQFPGQRFAVFYRKGDSLNQSITTTFPTLNKKVAPPTLGGDNGDQTQVYAKHLTARGYQYGTNDHCFMSGALLANGVNDAVAGSAEFLRVEIGASGRGVVLEGRASVVSFWAVGRVTVRAEMRSFDEPFDKDSQVAAETAFLASWGLRMQVRSRDLTDHFHRVA